MSMLIKSNNSFTRMFSITGPLIYTYNYTFTENILKIKRHNYVIKLIQIFRNGLQMEFSSQWNNKEVENVIFIVVTSKHLTVFS